MICIFIFSSNQNLVLLILNPTRLNMVNITEAEIHTNRLTEGNKFIIEK